MRAKVHKMVLTPSDVRHGFRRTLLRSYDAEQLAAQGGWTLTQLRSWGYVVGWEAQYDRGLDTHVDPAQLSSDAGGYRSARGADRSLGANQAACARGGWHTLGAPRLGQRSVACYRNGEYDGYQGTAFFVAWRCGRYKGAVTLTGPRRRFDLSDALPFARRQARRMGC